MCHASQGSKQPVSRKWVSLLPEIPMNEGLLLRMDDSGTPCGQLSHHGLHILPARATPLTWQGHDGLPGRSLTMGGGGGDTGGYMTTVPSSTSHQHPQVVPTRAQLPLLWGLGALAQETGLTALQVGAQSRED